jgi:hypothetical protein
MFWKSIGYDQLLFIPTFTVVISCSGNGITWRYGLNDPPYSSVIIVAGSLTSNRTYQFQVDMINRHNSILRATGYLLVQVESTHLPMIAMA